MIMTAIFLALFQAQTMRSEAEKKVSSPENRLLRVALDSGKYECRMMSAYTRTDIGGWDKNCAEALAAIEIWNSSNSDVPSLEVYVVIRPRKEAR